MANRRVPISARPWLLAPGLALAGILLLASPVHAGFLDLSWNAPTTNADGTALTDLASYRVYYGTSSSPCPGSTFQPVASSSPTGGGTVTYRLTGLQTGIAYYVGVTAVDTGSNESACSNQTSGLARSIEVSFLTALGPGPGLEAQVRGFTGTGGAAATSFLAYPTGVDQGANVALCDVDGDGVADVITGPGPGPGFGAHVKGFRTDGTPIPGLSFLAYPPGVFYGVNVACGDLDGDGRAEILTGQGPGPGLGAHVRVFRYDPVSQSVRDTGVSFLAYPPGVDMGVNVAAGDLDGDGRAEILTGPGPGPGFGSHVRGFRFAPTEPGGASDAGVSFLAYPNGMYYGVRVGAPPRQ